MNFLIKNLKSMEINKKLKTLNHIIKEDTLVGKNMLIPAYL